MTAQAFGTKSKLSLVFKEDPSKQQTISIWRSTGHTRIIHIQQGHCEIYRSDHFWRYPRRSVEQTVDVLAFSSAKRDPKLHSTRSRTPGVRRRLDDSLNGSSTVWTKWGVDCISSLVSAKRYNSSTIPMIFIARSSRRTTRYYSLTISIFQE